MTNIKANNALILLTTVLASGMAFLDTSTTNIALPAIQAELNANISTLQWVVTGYSLTLASLLLISGSLGDRFGHKKMFNIGIGFFILFSLLSALSQSTNQLILFQILQGAGAALMIPQSLAIISGSFEENKRGKAIGIWAGLAGAISAMGPLAGGFLVEQFGWQSIFLINLPLGLITLLCSWKFITSQKPTTTSAKHFSHTILVVAGLFGITYGFIKFPELGLLNVSVVGPLLFGLISLTIFVWLQKRSTSPLLPLSIFSSPNVLGANLVTLLIYSGLAAMVFLLTLNFQQIQGYSPSIAGLALLPDVLIITLFTGLGGKLADKYGARRFMIVSPLLVAASFVMFTIPGANANFWTTFFPAEILFGFGMAGLIAPLTKSALAVPPEFSGTASGANNAISRIAGVMAIAIIGAITISIFQASFFKSIEKLNVDNETKQELIRRSDKMSGITLPESMTQNDKATINSAIESSFVSGFRWSMIVMAMLALCGSIVSYLTIDRKRISG